MYSSDFRWYKHHIDDLKENYRGKLWTQTIAWPKDVDPADWNITALEGNHLGKSFSTDSRVIHTGQNSGFAACNLAYHFGAGIIILLGFDMCMAGDKRHFFGAHPGHMEVASNYTDFMKNYEWIDLKALGIEIWNCSRRTAMQHFPIYDLDTL